MHYRIDISHNREKEIYALSNHFGGTSPNKDELSFTNYYMEINHKPFFGISGEFHFSRCSDIYWEDEILKMKMGGINVISTYIFWIHHEEQEGKFCFAGRRDLRKFILLCKKHGMYVIVRIGPFDHGEVRNGGFPDWLYGKPFEARMLNKGFLYYTKRLYDRLAKEMEGLYYKDQGPIIAAQIDNEYEHSSAPWEITTGVSNEWVFVGNEGDAYMLELKKMAQESGIIVPFYTCTAWGGAAAPSKEMMPLWGGYAYRPWIFYSHKGEHPATGEYIYRDHHNNEIPKTYNFEPGYPPESVPYACCEMGGGMTCSYHDRFLLPYESVDAMANIKMASGCNFLGYYMYKGGTNPKGEQGGFLNESQMPKLSYDYQAALGEFGQIRDSYKRLKLLHLFASSFESDLCTMQTALPGGAEQIAPEDTDTLRFAVRYNKNGGFLFINNFQDHVETKVKTEECVTVITKGGEITFKSLSLATGENCILPFHMQIEGRILKYATVQPITKLCLDGAYYYFFFTPEGMEGKYVWENGEEIKIPGQPIHSYRLEEDEKVIHLVTLSRKMAMDFYKANQNGNDMVLITDMAVLQDEYGIRFETGNCENRILAMPDGILENIEKTGKTVVQSKYPLFTEYRYRVEEKPPVKLLAKQTGPTRYCIDLPGNLMESVKDAILKIDYTGDIGQAFINGEMISDNFCSGGIWEIGLKEFADSLKEHPLTIYITPIKKGVHVNVESAMAARMEQVDGITGMLHNVSIAWVYGKDCNFHRNTF